MTERCCALHTEPGEAKYTCHSAPGVTDPCCSDCPYWVSWVNALDGDDEE